MQVRDVKPLFVAMVLVLVILSPFAAGLAAGQGVRPLAATNLPAARQSASALAQIPDPSGTWDTDFGRMTLEVDGLAVRGSYERGNGRLSGIYDPRGSAISGFWMEEPTHASPANFGPMVMLLASDGQSFQGQWGHGATDLSNEWQGRRSSAAPLAPSARPAPGGGFAGEWQVGTHDVMILTVDGARVTGTYSPASTLMSGILSSDGLALMGVWTQNPTRSLPEDAGQFVLRLAKDGGSWNGRWGRDIEFDQYSYQAFRPRSRIPPGTVGAKPVVQQSNPTATAVRTSPVNVAQPTPTAEPPSGPGAAVLEAGLAGVWDTDFGVMMLQVDGAGAGVRPMSGMYAYKNGRLSGALSPGGRTFIGSWNQEPTRNGPQDAGEIILQLSDAGQGFAGRWTYGTGPQGGAVNGTRHSAPVNSRGP